MKTYMARHFHSLPIRLSLGLALMVQLLVSPATPTSAQSGPPVTFSPDSVAIGGTLSVSASGFDINCNNPATVDLVDATTLVPVVGPSLGRTAFNGCSGSFTNQSFRVPSSVAPGVGRYRVRVRPDGFP